MYKNAKGMNSNSLDIHDKNAKLFLIEGAACTIASVFSNTMSNLFLTRVGASDYQLSLFATLTSIIGMFVLIPTAIFTDRLTNKRKMVISVLCFMAVCYLFAAASPFFNGYVVWVLIITAALGAGSVSLYTSVWQAYFADVIPTEKINEAFSKRNQVTFITRMVFSLSVGAILSVVTTSSGKIYTHQIYYLLAIVFMVLQIVLLMKIKGGDVRYKSGSKLSDVWEAAKDLGKNKKFLIFAAVVVLFYMTWRMDGTIFYLSQIKYVGLSEFWLNVSNTASAAAQVASVPLWIRLNNKFGCRFGIIFGALGLVISPLCIILPLGYTGTARLIIHLVFRFISDIGFTTVNLNLLQNLLQVIGEKNRTLSIAVYDTLIALVGCFMPIIGVTIYKSFGSDQTAMVNTFLIMGAFRLTAVIAFVIRWYAMRREPK